MSHTYQCPPDCQEHRGPRYGRAYPPWERAPGKDTSAELRIIWLETAIGVFLLNTDQETQDLAVQQADKVLERLAERQVS